MIGSRDNHSLPSIMASSQKAEGSTMLCAPTMSAGPLNPEPGMAVGKLRSCGLEMTQREP